MNITRPRRSPGRTCDFSSLAARRRRRYPPGSMILLAQTTVVVPQMEGVTTVLAAFVFVCVCYPQLVKNRTQFYAAFTSVAVIILLFSLSVMLKDSPGFQVFAGAMTGLLQLAAFILLFL